MTIVPAFAVMSVVAAVTMTWRIHHARRRPHYDRWPINNDRRSATRRRHDDRRRTWAAHHNARRSRMSDDDPWQRRQRKADVNIDSRTRRRRGPEENCREEQYFFHTRKETHTDDFDFMPARTFRENIFECFSRVHNASSVCQTFSVIAPARHADRLSVRNALGVKRRH
jgi:hypothetical protein